MSETENNFRRKLYFAAVDVVVIICQQSSNLFVMIIKI